MFVARRALTFAVVIGVPLLAAAFGQNVSPDDAGKAANRPAGRRDPAPRDSAQLEQALRASAEEFVSRYNQHDAQALGAEFTDGAEFVTEGRKSLRGPEQIAAHFAALFEEFPKARLRMTVDSVRQISAGVALEEGACESELAPNGTVEYSRYVALHVREGGAWRIAAVRDFAIETAENSRPGRLNDLEWLIGEWIHEDDYVTTRIHCRWADNRRFLLQDLELQVTGQPPIRTSTRIGWDPLARQFRSWTFDSHGGFSEGKWTPSKTGWLIKSQGVTRLGRSFSTTADLRQIDSSTLTLSSRDRVEGGAVIVEGREITVERVPPPPEN